MSLKTTTLHTQQDLLLDSLKDFYTNTENLKKIIDIVNGESNISLRIVDWFVTNYAKKYFTVFEIPMLFGTKEENVRFKVYNEYKLKLKAYSKNGLTHFVDGIELIFHTMIICIWKQRLVTQFFKWAYNIKELIY